MDTQSLRKVTAREVATAAGVSLATVDRVINHREGVRHETRERVRAVIEDLGFHPDIGAANLARQRTYRFLFVIPAPGSAFSASLTKAVGEAPKAVDGTRVSVVIREVQASLDGNLADELRAIDPRQWDGVAVKAVDAPGVREAIDRLTDAGVPVVTLVSDVPSSRRLHYVGIDNTAAGRVVGRLMGRFLTGRPGKVGIIAGSMLLHDNVQRWIGFEQVMRSEFGFLEILQPAESGDSRVSTEAITRRLLGTHDDLVGIYSLSAGNLGVLAALADVRPDPRPVLMVHELSPPIRDAVLNGTIDVVINQNTSHEARSAVRVLKAFHDQTSLVESQEKIRIDVFLKDNLP